MADGSSKPISKVKVGDKVMATDPRTGERGPRTVTRLWIHKDKVLDLEVDGDTISTTEDHPFWNATDGEFQRADHVARGEQLLAADGKFVPVIGIRSGSQRTATAYNLTVDGIHTYYVLAGDTPVLVHNSGCWSTRHEKAGDLAGNYTEGQSTRDPASQWYHEELSNDELLDGINNAAAGDGIVVSSGGIILGGHHRWDELLKRINDGAHRPRHTNPYRRLRRGVVL